jgi:hypothetical protein
MSAFTDRFTGLGKAFGIDSLTGAEGYQIAAEAARQAQQQARNSAQQQWMRQMQGLGLAQQSLAPYRTLYDSIYGTNTQGSVPMAPGGNAMDPSGAYGPMPARAPTQRGQATGAYNPQIHGGPGSGTASVSAGPRGAGGPGSPPPGAPAPPQRQGMASGGLASLFGQVRR